MSLINPPRFGSRTPRQSAPTSHPTDLSALSPGDLIDGRYQIEALLTADGARVVYRASQRALDRPVAIALLAIDAGGREDVLSRLRQEVVALAALAHPGIASMRDHGFVDGHPFVVFELSEGRTLRELLDREGVLLPRRALGLIRQMALALAHAHARGIAHGNLTPAQVNVQTLPALEHVTLRELGLLRLSPDSLVLGDGSVQPRAATGTLPYMSAITPQGSDLVHLGKILFEMLTGTRPMEGDLEEDSSGGLTVALPKVASVRPSLAHEPGLQTLLDRMLTRDGELHPSSALDLVALIDTLLQPASSADSCERTHTAGTRDDDYALEDALGLRSRLPLDLARARVRAAAFGVQVRSAWNAHGKPALARANAEGRVLAARFIPWSRRVLRATWIHLRPRVVRAAERISKLAIAARDRIEQSAPPARPPAHERRAATDASASRAAPFETQVERTARPLPALPRDASVSAHTSFGDASAEPRSSIPSREHAHDDALALPIKSARETAEPLVLEPRDAGRSSPL